MLRLALATVFFGWFGGNGDVRVETREWFVFVWKFVLLSCEIDHRKNISLESIDGYSLWIVEKPTFSNDARKSNESADGAPDGSKQNSSFRGWRLDTKDKGRSSTYLQRIERGTYPLYFLSKQTFCKCIIWCSCCRVVVSLLEFMQK